LSPADDDGLSAWHLGILKEHCDRWTRIRLSTAPSDRDAAAEGVAIAYAAAGFPPPQRIEWAGSPIEIARLWMRGPRSADAGASLSAVIVDKLRQDVDTRVRRRVNVETITRIAEANHRPVADMVGMAVRQAVNRTANAIQPNLLTLVHRTINRPSSLKNVFDVSLTFGESSISQHDLGWIGAYVFLREVFNLHEEIAPLFGLKLLASAAGWFLPCEHICWLGERHDRLRYDERGRLHCSNGPALRYPDGWSVYAWKGIIIPQALVDERTSITIRSIDRETDIHIRRCMIEIMTPERYIAQGGAIAVSTDDCGTLWRKRWANGDAWSAVEVVNGTPQSDGSAKHHFLQVPIACRTPREAVAWTYGMNEYQYSRLVTRT
jgi:hypothetical protein